MAQASITNFFVTRKRAAADDLKGKSKIMALDSDSINAGYGRAKPSEISTQPAALIKVEATVVVAGDEASTVKSRPAGVPAAFVTPKAKTPARTRRAAAKPKDSKQPDMKTFLRGNSAAKRISEPQSLPADPGCNAQSPACSEIKEERSDVCEASEAKQAETAPVAVEQAATNKQEEEVKEDQGNSAIGPAASGITIKVEVVAEHTNSNSDKASTLNPNDSAAKRNMDTKETAQSVRRESNVEKARKELSLGDIKSKLTRSARLAELKASMARFDAGREKLNKIEQAKKNEDTSKGSKPQLSQFNSIELEVPVSPSKSPMKSPMKSPHKGLAGSRSPAFQRYSALAQPGTPALTLPCNYRHLAELFRCVDTVVSLLFNRKEVITFKKLQPAVQEMSRRSFTKGHLAQMVSVYPEAFMLKQEKVHSFGTLSKQEKYELVIAPILDSNPAGENCGSLTMTPSVLLERKRIFFNNLLNIVKKHHQEFLQSLVPPIVVPMGVLTRWHPEFAVDQVPDLPTTPLPQPPNLENCCSAKDVLAKARQLYSCNARMEKALESVAQSNGNPEAPIVDVEVVNAPTPNPPSSPFKGMQLSSALKGIPKALLEKVRARQAAKAMEAMTRTSAQDKEAAQYARLPEIARILRNVFVAEKKGALPVETVLEKVNNSYRSAMSLRELEEHIRLLAKVVPGWVTFEHLLKTDYLRLSKKGDMNRVMNRLNELASNKQGITGH